MSDTKEIGLSKEFRRGDLHRHHSFDYHPVVKHHALPYHDYLLRTTYEMQPMSRTRIAKLTNAAHNAMVHMSEYEITCGPVTEAGYQYLVTHTKKNDIPPYTILIGKDQSYKCSCPGFGGYYKLGLPCKHVILVACTKGHEIKI